MVLNSGKPYLDKVLTSVFCRFEAVVIAFVSLQMDPDAGSRFLGVFIAGQALAQLISSPVLGFLANRLGSVRWLLMFSILVTGFGFAFYASVGLFPPPRKWYLFTARVIMGLAGGKVVN